MLATSLQGQLSVEPVKPDGPHMATKCKSPPQQPQHRSTAAPLGHGALCSRAVPSHSMLPDKLDTHTRCATAGAEHAKHAQQQHAACQRHLPARQPLAGHADASCSSATHRQRPVRNSRSSCAMTHKFSLVRPAVDQEYGASSDLANQLHVQVLAHAWPCCLVRHADPFTQHHADHPHACTRWFRAVDAGVHSSQRSCTCTVGQAI